MITGFADEAALRDAHFEIAAEVSSDSNSKLIEATVYHRFLAENPPDGLLVGSAMAAVSGAEGAGRHIGSDFELVAKEAISFLRRFRKDMLVVHEDVGRAGDLLARALIAAIERPAPEAGQFLNKPDHLEAGNAPQQR